MHTHTGITYMYVYVYVYMYIMCMCFSVCVYAHTYRDIGPDVQVHTLPTGRTWEGKRGKGKKINLKRVIIKSHSQKPGHTLMS